MTFPHPRFCTVTAAIALAFPSVTGGFLHAKQPKPSPGEAPSQMAPSPPGRRQAGAQPDGSVLVTTNQIVTPLGKVQTVADERPKDLALSPDGSLLAVLTTAKVHFYKTADGTPVDSAAVKPGSLGLAWSPDGRTLFASGAGGMVYRLASAEKGWSATAFTIVDKKKPVKVFQSVDTSPPSAAKPADPVKPEPHVTGLAVSPDGRYLYAALSISNAVAVHDLTGQEEVRIVTTGLCPYRILLSPDGGTLYTANRGGRAALDNEPGALSAGSRVRIDPDTDAALRGSVSIIDTKTLKSVEIEAGRQPAALALSADQKLLYVAQSDEDTVGVLDLGTRKFVRSIALLPPQDPGFGQIPTGLALAGDGKTLFVTCGGINAVAAIALPDEKISGYFPAGWFPVALAESKGSLFVASSKGFGSRAPAQASLGKRSPKKAGAPVPAGEKEEDSLLAGKSGFGVKGSLGTIQFITPAQQQAGSEHTRRVALNNGWGQAELPARLGLAPVPVPERVGEPSVFKHVVFVIKENHTYDINLGDMKEGNGDPSLCLFGEDVTPNQHALARQWVLLDNTYTSGTNSADGHQWTVSGVANAYMEQNFSVKARSYPFNGGDPLAYSPKGFLWNAAVKAGKSVRVYGEFVNKSKVVDTTGQVRNPSWKDLWADYKAGTGRFQMTAETDNATLTPHLHPHYVGFVLNVSDQWRADQYLAELKGWAAGGEMPALSIVLLPADHTSGTKPGMPTPRAAVADNDLALGRIVEEVSQSRFWPETLIMVIEDDSQLGLDHVDGHRTTAFCISPYTKRGAVVSEVYNHTSLLRTMELVLGLPAMSRFDRTATSMTACFTTQRDDRPFTHVENRIPLDELNPSPTALKGAAKQFALACVKLDWSDVDRADATVLARSAWNVQRPGVPFPWSKFHPAKDDDDD
jgi:DNA-binding beta-propeller fold protein YncE